MKRLLYRLLSLAVLLSALLGGWFWMDYQNYMDSTLNVGDDGYVFELKPGMNLTRLVYQLKREGIVDKPRYLLWSARLHGKANLIKVGEYRISKTDTASQLLDNLFEGKVIQYSLTLVEGWNFKQFMDAIHSDPNLEHTLKGLSNKQIMAKLGYPDQHPEGRFLPDTYHFPRGLTDVEFLQRAYQAMEKVLDEEWKNRADKLAIKTPYEALILASIVEKETGLASERKMIAGVFTRRLFKRMRLQTDPTVIYGMGERYKGNIRTRDLREKTPYNTYLIFGLPPTPIAMPGRAAINAAVHPQQGDELYFVSRGDGSHYFSSTLEEHNKAVIKYQLNGRNRPFSSNR